MSGKLFNKLKPYIHWERFSFQHALSTAIITVLAYTYTLYYPNTQTNWLILSAILLSQSGLRTEQTWTSLLYTLYYPLAAFLTATFVLLFSLDLNFWLILPLLTATTFISNYLSWHKRKFFFLCLLINFLSILASFYPCSLELALERAELTMIAGFLVFIVRFFFFLYQRPRRASNAWLIFLQKLSALYSFTEQQEENLYQAAWSDCLAALQAFKKQEALLRPDKKFLPPQAERYLERIWELTMSLSSLRYRLSDKHIFRMSESELSALTAAIQAILKQCRHPNPENLSQLPLQKLEVAIQAFEELYQGMLQTVAPEPLVLLLFIQDLHALKEELEKFAFSATASPEEEEGKAFEKVTAKLKSKGLLSNSPYFLQRRAFRSAFAIALALILGQYFSPTHSFWLAIITLLVTQSELGLPFHQSLRKALWILIILLVSMTSMSTLPPEWQPWLGLVVVASAAYTYAYCSRRYLSLHFSLLLLMVLLLALLFPASNTQLSYLYDALGGVFLGLLATLLVFPDKADLEFSERVLPLMKALSHYLAELGQAFLEQPKSTLAPKQRQAVETLWANRDEYFPVWVFEPGFNPLLRPGHSYVVIHLGQITEILFALNHLARHRFKDELFQRLMPGLKDCFRHSEELFTPIQTVLQGKKLILKPSDYVEDLAALEKDFRSQVELSLELLDLSRDYVYLAALLRTLKDLRLKLLEIASTLR